MEIFITLGVVVSVLIICATVILNSMIDKSFLRIKKALDNRGDTISSISYRIGAVERALDILESRVREGADHDLVANTHSTVTSIQTIISDYERKMQEIWIAN